MTNAASKKMEDKIVELGNTLASPPPSVEQLLPLLDVIDGFLSRVEQSPSEIMSTALKPLMSSLVGKELLRHSDMDVKVAVASCISEITRITAPEAPYEDDLMKEIFQMIVGTFEGLDDITSSSFSKRVSILETVAKVRSCVVMLDLECDALILEMFHHFVKTIRLDHSENVFSSMETIMTLVIEESEDISSELLSCLLDAVKNDNKGVQPIACKLVEKVMGTCAEKIRSSLKELVQSRGVNLSEYSEIVTTVCLDSSDEVVNNEQNTSGEILADDSKLSERTVSDELPQVSTKLEQEAGCPEKVSTAADNPPRAVMTNGTVQMGNGDSVAEPTSPKQKPERSRRNGASKNITAADQADLDNLDPVLEKPDGTSNVNTKKVRGRKTNSSVLLTDTTEHSRIDNDKEAPAATSRRKGRIKEADGPSSKEVESVLALEPENKNEHLSGSDNPTVCVTSPTPSESPLESSRTKRSRSAGSKVAAKRTQTDATTEHSASVSVSGHKDTLENLPTEDEVMTSKDVDSEKEPDSVIDSEEKPLNHLGKNVESDNADNGKGGPTTVTSDSEAKPQRHSLKKKSKTEAVSEPGSLGRRQKSNLKQQKGKGAKKDVAGEPSLKEMISSPKTTTKAPSRGQSHLEDSSQPKSSRKRSRQKTEATNDAEYLAPDGKTLNDETLVGYKIEVFWPDDNEYYHGVVESYDADSKRHRVVYDDGDEEILLLKDEKWRFAKDDFETDGGKEKGTPGTDVSEKPPSKKSKGSSNSVSKQAKTPAQSKSGTESSGKDGRSTKDVGGSTKAKARSRGSNQGKISYDISSPGTSRKFKGKAVSEDDKHKTPQTTSKLKGEPENESEDDAPNNSNKLDSGNKSRDESRKVGGKIKFDTSKSGDKPKEDPRNSGKNDTPKSGKRSKIKTPESAKSNRKVKDETSKANNSKSKNDTSKSTEPLEAANELEADIVEDDVVGSVNKQPKFQTPKSRSRKGTPKSGQSSKIAATPKTGGDSRANSATGKGKGKVQASEQSAGAQEGEVTKGVGKKRKRKGRN